VLPDAAAEVRWRRFDTEPVGRAVGLGRLIVRGSVPEDDRGRAGAILEEVRSLRAVGHRTIGIYAKTNNDAAGLSVELADLGLWHIPIGFSEVYGEALAAMDAMAEYAAGGGEWPDVLTALAVTMAASVRSPSPPALSVALHRGEGYPRLLQQRLDELRRLLSEAPDVGDLAEVAASAWTQLGLTAGRRSWERAGRTFTAVARRAAMDRLDSRVRLSRSISEMRTASFVELDAGDTGAIQLMNFSQTKGREADAVILSYTSSDFYGRAAREPYDEPSRLLYVSMTRASRTVVVFLPTDPHLLVAPFSRYA
jgi:hypothetical protein